MRLVTVALALTLAGSAASSLRTRAAPALKKSGFSSAACARRPVRIAATVPDIKPPKGSQTTSLTSVEANIWRSMRATGF